MVVKLDERGLHELMGIVKLFVKLAEDVRPHKGSLLMVQAKEYLVMTEFGNVILDNKDIRNIKEMSKFVMVLKYEGDK